MRIQENNFTNYSAMGTIDEATKKFLIHKHGEKCMKCGWDIKNIHTLKMNIIDEPIILITERQLRFKNFGLYLVGFFNMLYVYSYMNMTAIEKKYWISYIFATYICGSLFNFYVDYKNKD